MTPNDWLALPIQIQIVLATGYMGHCLARRGYPGKDNGTALWFGVLSFGLFGWAGWELAGRCTASFLAKMPAAVAAAVGVGLLWRLWGRATTMKALRWARISWEDDLGPAWTRMIQDTRMAPTEVRVKLKNGDVLKCFDVQSFGDAALPCGTFDNDGNVALYVTDVISANGEERTLADVRNSIYGDLVTHVSREDILHVSIRYKKF